VRERERERENKHQEIPVCIQMDFCTDQSNFVGIEMITDVDEYGEKETDRARTRARERLFEQLSMGIVCVCYSLSHWGEWKRRRKNDDKRRKRRISTTRENRPMYIDMQNGNEEIQERFLFNRTIVMIRQYDFDHLLTTMMHDSDETLDCDEISYDWLIVMMSSFGWHCFLHSNENI
jgi:hypothetical protein